MSMYCTPVETPTARKEHQCTWCSQPILPGEKYQRWTSFDDAAFANKMHPECADACNEECSYWGENEYHAFSNERPAPTSAEGANATKGKPTPDGAEATGSGNKEGRP